MKKTLLIFIGLFIYSSFSYGQIIASTEEGRKVLLNEDGTWKYQDEIFESKEDEDNVTDFSCESLTVTSEDKMTGKQTTSAKESLVISKDGKNGFGMFIMKSKKSIIISTTVVGSGSCIDDDGKANILFKDGTKLELVNNGKFNCKGKFTLYMGSVFGNKKALKELKTKEVETIRIWTSKSYVQEDFNKEQSEKLMAILNCLNE